MLCSAMLSEQIVLAVSTQYFDNTWPLFYTVLRQLSQISLRNQRIIGIMLEECPVPDVLCDLNFIHCSSSDFLDTFVNTLNIGILKITYCAQSFQLIVTTLFTLFITDLYMQI